jgi:hypothetical protein
MHSLQDAHAASLLPVFRGASHFRQHVSPAQIAAPWHVFCCERTLPEKRSGAILEIFRKVELSQPCDVTGRNVRRLSACSACHLSPLLITWKNDCHPATSLAL